jgi:LacI family transcriptional regulator
MIEDTTESIPRPPRLSDVAAAAGVSLSTASRVLSGRGASERTVEAVHTAMRRLDYRPNPIARALRAQTTGTVGMLVPELANPFFAELIEAAERALHRSGLDLLLGDSLGSVEAETRRLQTFVDRRVDGLIVIAVHHRDSAPALVRAQRVVPVVQLDRSVEGLESDYVGVDNERGIELVLDHLVEQGARCIAFVSATEGSSSSRSRLAAFQRGITRLGPAVEALPPLLGAFSVAFGRTAVRQLLAVGPLPDAIVCGSDTIALGVVRELHHSSVDVPGDVRVTGFDGILFAELIDPPLTTVQQPVASIAEEAVRLLTSRLGGVAGAARRSQVSPTLIRNASSMRAAG